MIQQQILTYANHTDEIVYLNKLLDELRLLKPLPAELEPTVRDLVKRLATLQEAQAPVLVVFDPRIHL